VVVINAEEAGTITVTPYVDGKEQTNVSLSSPIAATYTVEETRSVPFGAGDTSNVKNIPFAFKRVSQGWKVGFLIEWSCMAEISHIQHNGEEQVAESGLQAQVEAYTQLR
jgi:hypothetical protein